MDDFANQEDGMRTLLTKWTVNQQSGNTLALLQTIMGDQQTQCVNCAE